jgi:hypothetical protein
MMENTVTPLLRGRPGERRVKRRWKARASPVVRALACFNVSIDLAEI